MAPSSPTAAANRARILRFMMDGREVAIEDPPATMTVLEYLREAAGRRGTKEGCAEGDCGACTVVVGELDPDRKALRYRAVNSCIRFLATLDGKELVTVESLRQPSGDLHPVQKSMVDNHGSQCGFCTPGFVMSLFALYLERDAAQRADVVDALSGNLCRCTGYRPIIDAGLQQWSYPAPAHWSRADAQSQTHIDALRGLAREPGEDASLHCPGYHAPRTLDELGAALETNPGALLLAGGTDVGLWSTKQLRELPHMIYLGDIAELAHIDLSPEELRIGAAVTFSDAWPALLRLFPALEEQAARFASTPIRNSATLCGNLANGSPIGDSIPALIALGAQIELRHGKARRRLPLEDFYLGYQVKALGQGEFVSGVAIPAPIEGQMLASFKLSKRIDQDISAVCATFCVRTEDGRVLSARLAYGGMAATPCRAAHAERALEALGWNEAGLEGAVAALAQDFKPLSDMRAGSDYRLRTAGALLRRFYLQSRGGTAALRTADALAGTAYA
jgi:xanthine dehydrogenase small subunit